MSQNSDPLGGRPTTAHYLNKKQALFIVTKSETYRAIEVTLALVEKFDAYERGLIQLAQPALPQTYRQALLALAAR